jgi:hypothetical protein
MALGKDATTGAVQVIQVSTQLNGSALSPGRAWKSRQGPLMTVYCFRCWSALQQWLCNNADQHWE